MKEWIKRAFENAEEQASDKEYKAYEDAIGKDYDTLIMAVAIKVGLERMDALCKTIADNGQQDTLVDFIEDVAMFSFHLGYHKGMEAIK